MSEPRMNVEDFKKLMDVAAQHKSPNSNMAEYHVDEERRTQALSMLQSLLASSKERKSVISMLEELGIEPTIAVMPIGGREEDCLVVPLAELVAKEFKEMTGVDITTLRTLQ